MEILRNDERIALDIKREIVSIDAVEYTMLDNNVGLITVYEFTEDNLVRRFNDALNELEKQGAESLILDLRDNTGGSVESAIGLADRFLDERMVYYTVSQRDGSIDSQYTKKGADGIPLVILVNEYSASSSEMLAGALQDYGRAVIVGTHTYGKGFIQYLAELSDGLTGIQFTYREYFTPKGYVVDGNGITPDVVVEKPEDRVNDMDFGDLSDPQLKAAWLEALRLAERAFR